MKHIYHLSIMIVDDSAASRQTMKLLLDEIGVAQTVSASTGNAALEILDELGGQVDAVFCDWQMPGLSGYDVLKQVRAAYPLMPFVMVTGNADAESVGAARASGVTDFIAKPFSPQTFKQKLERVAERL